MVIFLIALALAICFGGVLLVGAPYLPTLKPQIAAALELADLKPGDHLLELGCGDGRVALAAARAGLRVTGYELNPLLAVVARIRTWRYRKQVKIICADFWQTDWPPAEAVFVFLLDRFMSKLDKKLDSYQPKPIKLVSFAFKVPGKSPTAKKSGVYLYTYH
ncbi:MAG TPA: methyltransferase domain-containing protein [Candidatus Saccharimonadales bacterium]|nr:methyltransferase domain-containing protein [Candidatus Saccharimonadales bacterium]